jgi:copper(I)-binding protein
LAPDGYHLMLVDLKQPLRVGETFPLMLTFQRAGTVRTVVTVEPMGAAPPRTR